MKLHYQRAPARHIGKQFAALSCERAGDPLGCAATGFPDEAPSIKRRQRLSVESVVTFDKFLLCAPSGPDERGAVGRLPRPSVTLWADSLRIATRAPAEFSADLRTTTRGAKVGIAGAHGCRVRSL